MNPNTYRSTQEQIALIVEMVSLMPLDDFLAAIEHAETVGPLVDPTLYMRGSDALSVVKRHARALEAFQSATKVGPR